MSNDTSNNTSNNTSKNTSRNASTNTTTNTPTNTATGAETSAFTGGGARGRDIETSITRDTQAVSVRNATHADLEAIRAIYNESIPKRIATADLEPQGIDARRAWFANRDHSTRPVLVAEDAHGVCAWGAFTNFKDRAAYAPTAEISVYVADRAAGRGVGRAVLDALLAQAGPCGIDRILAICFAHNEPSLRLFRSRGFAEWGRFPEACVMDGVRRSVVVLGWARLGAVRQIPEDSGSAQRVDDDEAK